MLSCGKTRLIAKMNSDLYKIFSGVIDNILKKVIDKINIRSQKAHCMRYLNRRFSFSFSYGHYTVMITLVIFIKRYVL